VNRNGTPRNLKPWPKGVSGNPGGQSKAVAEARKKLESLAPDAVEVFAKLLKRRHFPAASKILDKTIPDPPKEVTGAGGGPLEVIVKYADR